MNICGANGQTVYEYVRSELTHRVHEYVRSEWTQCA